MTNGIKIDKEAAHCVCVTHVVVLGVLVFSGLATHLKMSLFGAFPTRGFKGPALGLPGLPARPPVPWPVLVKKLHRIL